MFLKVFRSFQKSISLYPNNCIIHFVFQGKYQDDEVVTIKIATRTFDYDHFNSNFVRRAEAYRILNDTGNKIFFFINC